MNCFAKFEKFLPHSIIIPSFMTVGSQMPELDRGRGSGLFPYKLITKSHVPFLTLVFMGYFDYLVCKGDWHGGLLHGS